MGYDKTLSNVYYHIISVFGDPINNYIDFPICFQVLNSVRKRMSVPLKSAFPWMEYILQAGWTPDGKRLVQNMSFVLVGQLTGMTCHSVLKKELRRLLQADFEDAFLIEYILPKILLSFPDLPGAHSAYTMYCALQDYTIIIKKHICKSYNHN